MTDKTDEKKLPRLGYDAERQWYFDRARPNADEKMVHPDGSRVCERCSPVAVCEEIEAERDSLEAVLREIAEKDCISILDGVDNRPLPCTLNQEDDPDVWCLVCLARAAITSEDLSRR